MMEKKAKSHDGSSTPRLEAKGEETAGTESEQTDKKLTTVFDGLESNVCRRCGRHLSAKRSVRHGYGDTCFRKVQAGDLKRAKIFERLEPRTVTDETWAGRVLQAIYRLIARLPESSLDHGRWLTGEDPKTLPLESFDHDGGETLPGFGKPQWFYLHSDKYDLAIWKIRIYDTDILAELHRMYPGEVPPAQPPAAAPQRPLIIEEPLDRASCPGIPCRQNITEEALAGVGHA